MDHIKGMKTIISAMESKNIATLPEQKMSRISQIKNANSAV